MQAGFFVAIERRDIAIESQITLQLHRFILPLPFFSPALSTVAIGVFHRGGSQAGGPRDEKRR
jgi:hypothetical protein